MTISDRASRNAPNDPYRNCIHSDFPACGCLPAPVASSSASSTTKHWPHCDSLLKDLSDRGPCNCAPKRENAIGSVDERASCNDNSCDIHIALRQAADVENPHKKNCPARTGGQTANYPLRCICPPPHRVQQHRLNGGTWHNVSSPCPFGVADDDCIDTQGSQWRDVVDEYRWVDCRK